ncbi:hypothetical protein [Nitrosomonas ureae]|uniref:DUF4760 domain-containing protein n=1 Tax=Nitrosomonas ureae TaxID=44577 RepID=A0A286A6A8_9PROT|nr:hypothetical protein [Nitrosomonas ureae]SOD17417.1 hypothetical protein SAMN06297164_1186 [Nitrosomonas ureae]
MHGKNLFTLFLVIMLMIVGVFIFMLSSNCITQDPQVVATIFVGLTAVIVSIFIGIINKRSTEQQTYQLLELAAIELFRFESHNSSICSLLHKEKGVKLQNMRIKTQIEFEAYITQVLNLFEIAIKYRLQKIFPADAFASWLPWMLEICGYATFRINWKEKFKPHYTNDLIIIIDTGIKCIEENRNKSQDSIKDEFYNRVAIIFKNDMTIKNWNKREVLCE